MEIFRVFALIVYNYGMGTLFTLWNDTVLTLILMVFGNICLILVTENDEKKGPEEGQDGKEKS